MALNSCISPPELDDQQLLMYLDGKRVAQVEPHLKQCPYCRERSHKLAITQGYMTAQLYRLTCPTSIELGDYVLGVLPTNRAAAVAIHLRDCPLCQVEIAQAADYLGDLLPNPATTPLEQVRVLVARLVGAIESGKLTGRPAFAPAYATLRGGAMETITLQADGILIALEAQSTFAGRMAILGQITADEHDNWTGATVELYQGEVLLATASVDDLGTFRYDDILPGTTELRLIPLRGPVVLVSVEIVS